MSCKNCKCAHSEINKKSLSDEMQRQVVLGHNYAKKKQLTIHSENFGKRRYSFVFEVAESNSYAPEFLYIDVGLAIHNPQDKFSKSVGEGLAAYSLMNNSMVYGVTVYRKAWKSLNREQKVRFIRNHLENLCMMEDLCVSRRAAMGGR